MANPKRRKRDARVQRGDRRKRGQSDAARIRDERAETRAQIVAARFRVVDALRGCGARFGIRHAVLHDVELFGRACGRVSPRFLRSFAAPDQKRTDSDDTNDVSHGSLRGVDRSRPMDRSRRRVVGPVAIFEKQ